MAKVSVIIPAHNRAAVIKRAVESVLAQTFEDMEIIVIDDGSTDHTGEIVQSIPDGRIRYIRCVTNRGAGAARNEGLQVATGKYVAFLDSDDEWLPEKMEKQVTLMESLSDEWGISCTGVKIIKDGCREVVNIPSPKKEGDAFYDFACGRIYTTTPALMVRKKVLDEVGFFDDRLWRGQDDELLMRVSRKYKLAILPEPLAVIHLATGKHLSHLVESARLLILEKHLATVRDELGWFSSRHFEAHTLWTIADAKFRDREFICGLRYWLRAVTAMPFMPPARFLRIALAASALLPHAKRVLWRARRHPMGALAIHNGDRNEAQVAEDSALSVHGKRTGVEECSRSRRGG